MKALILAGGKSERMGRYPKCMSFVRGKTVFERQIEWLHSGGIEPVDIYVSYGNRKEVYYYAARFVPEQNVFADGDKPLGDAGAIRKMMSMMIGEHSVLALNGDVLPFFNLGDFLKKVSEDVDMNYNSKGVVVFKPYVSSLGIMRITPFETQKHTTFRIPFFEEKPVLEGIYGSCGIYILNVDKIFGTLPETGDFARDVLEPYAVDFVPYFIGADNWIAVETVKDIKTAEEYLENKGIA